MDSKKRLRPDQRIRKQEAFKKLVEKGCFTRGEFFYLWTGEQNTIGQKACRARPMLGIIVTRGVDSRATRRNRLKRWIRETFRDQQSRLKAGMAFLIKVKKTQKLTSFPRMKEDLIAMFKKAEVWL